MPDDGLQKVHGGVFQSLTLTDAVVVVIAMNHCKHAAAS